MSLAVVRSRAPASGRAPEVTVEVHLANGLPSFSIVGLPDLEVRESRERVRAALLNCGLDFPVRRMNPCPCGWRGDPGGGGRCIPEITARYMRKLSGPLLDRIDIQIEVPALSPAERSASSTASGEVSQPIAQRVEAARSRQHRRQGKTNRELSGREVDDVCRPHSDGERLLREAGDRFGWSARAYYRVLKVARTIADLAGDDVPNAAQVSEAVQYRRAFSTQ
jgi:magnesium chelatase family protein